MYVFPSAFGCPYSAMNMNKELAIQDRLGSSRETLEQALTVANSAKSGGAKADDEPPK